MEMNSKCESEPMKKSMAEEISKKLIQIMKDNKKVMVCTADLASSCYLMPVKELYPEQFIDFGIAEQNMLSVAAGMAHEGFIPIVFSFAVFVTMRACEQLRTDIFYNQSPVIVVGTHSGFSTGPAGPTHFSIEDIGLVAVMPESRIEVPGDAASAAKIIENLIQDPKPTYIRLDRNPLPEIYADSENFSVELPGELEKGSDVMLLGCGTGVSTALEVSTTMREQGVTSSVWDIHMLKPVDTAYLKGICAGHRLIVTIEEHSKTGGLGGIIADVISTEGLNSRLMKFGIDDLYPKGGPVESIRKRLKLDSESISEQILADLKS